MYVVADYMVPMKGFQALSRNPQPIYSEEIQNYLYDYWYEFKGGMQVDYTSKLEKANTFKTIEEAEAFLAECKKAYIYTDGLKVVDI